MIDLGPRKTLKLSHRTLPILLLRRTWSSNFHPTSYPPSRSPRSQILATSIRASDDWNFGSRIVDENMFLLRKRIHEMKMVERNYEAPAGWMDWEKKYHLAYASHAHENISFRQSTLAVSKLAYTSSTDQEE
ncbi:hypothetical protein EJ110_NYTH45570 [Nymphaea thermarum]|nr:hypothetical protein EJ110_NYTH45570 [Nymphaea thermarum]